MLPAQTTVTGVITKTTFMEKTGAFWVIQVKDLADPQHSFTAIGNVPELKDQHAYRFEGYWQDHATYGRQFKVVDACPTVPRERAMLTNYLAWGTIKGIKGGLAEKIVDHFGEATLDILTHSPMRLTEIEGIGPKKCHKIMTSLADHEGFSENELFMAGLGLTRKMVTKIIKRYGDSSQKIVEETPYRLYRDISGVGFARADEIAQKVGYPPDGIQRIEAAILYILTSATDDGHCYLTSEQLDDRLPGTVHLAEEVLAELVPEALANLEGFGRVVRGDVAGATGWFLPDLYLAEQDVAAVLLGRIPTKGEAGEPQLDEFTAAKIAEMMTELSGGQKAAVLRCVAGDVAIITGGPGVGKTTTANAVIHSLIRLGHTVALAAPTGRAAQRLSTTSGLDAKTIHRLLEWNPSEGGFTRNKDNPLTCTALLIDEASMIDIRLAASLLAAVPESCKLIFLGDADQLPPIGPGNFLADMIASQQVPCSLLTEIFRQAKDSHIIMAAHHINKGQLPRFDNATDCKFIEVADTGAALATICRLIAQILPSKTEYDPVRDIQVLSPMNKGPIGTEAINTALKQHLQDAGFLPEAKQAAKADAPEFARLSVGDKVIQMTNNYELQVYNGDIGYVVGAQGKGQTTTIKFGDKLVEYDQGTIPQVRLAYGISIHKSQGSEFQVVIIPIAKSHSRMLDRNLVYTGLTRAKKLVILVGEKPTLAAAVRKQHSRQRQTTLVHRLSPQAAPPQGLSSAASREASSRSPEASS